MAVLPPDNSDVVPPAWESDTVAPSSVASAYGPT
jgi:hypothetical protein